MTRRLVCLSLSMLAMAGCSAPMPANMAAMPFADGVASLARAAIGGAAYNAFRIQPELPEPKDTRAAVKLTYLMNDDQGHQSPWSTKMLYMLDDLPQSRVHNVVFRDGNQAGDSRLFYIQKGDSEPGKVNNPMSLLAPGVNEVQSNNPKVFSQVLGWTFDHYPAKRHYLQLYTHGAGAMGVGTDSMQTDMTGKLLPKEQQIWAMPIPAFAEALRQGLKGRQLDAIYFRACLMGNVEALYELRGTTRYALASEDVSYSTDNSNMTLPKLFDDLAGRDADPQALVREMAIQALAKSVKTPDGEHSGYTSMAAVDIGRMDELKSAINSLTVALKAAMPKSRATILAAYDAVPAFNGKEEPDTYYEHSRDLWAFTAQLQQKVAEPGVQAAVQNLRKAQKAVMVHERDSFGSAANGLSIFMPARKGDPKQWAGFFKNDYPTLRFARDSGWDDFLKSVLVIS
ncbi:MAG: hypothetical protein H7338_00655 [Candidatus Sericytochromatia bacterium]|nr:hypothetical protein [Candidatus Sericytochromatia bacterium]